MWQITGVAQQLAPLESWADVDMPPGYIEVKVLPECTDRAHQIVQENVEKLYAPVEVYKQYLGEFPHSCTRGCIRLCLSVDIWLQRC
jgi:hypothetical protein